MRPNPHRPRRPAAVFARRRLATAGFAFLLAVAVSAAAQGQPSGVYGALAPGESRENVLAPAGTDALVYHTYTVTVPAGLASLTVAVDGMGNDVDLALRFGAEITAYDEVNGDADYQDFSEEPNPSYRATDPPAGVLYIDVINLIGLPAAYRLSVSAQPRAAAGGDLFAGTFAGDGVVLVLSPAAGGYQGRIESQGQSYPVTAQAQGGGLSGSFVSAGQSFPFEAVLAADLLTLTSGGASYRLVRQGAAAAQPAPAQPAPAQPAPAQPAPAGAAEGTAPGLVGTWTHLEDFGYGVTIEKSLHLLPDGRYVYVASGDFPVQEEGRYAVTSGRIAFAPHCSADYDVEVQLAGDELAVTSVDMFGDATTTVYRLEPGSPGSVVGMMTAIDAERADFHAQTPTGPVVPGARSPEPGFPVDPAPERHVPGATVFVEGELYSYVSSYTYVMDIYGRLQTVNSSDIVFNTPKLATLDYTRGEYRDSGLWLLSPNGRAYLEYKTYWNAVDITTNPLTPNIVSAWGRYRIEGDDVVVETDDGEQITLELLFGRRKLSQNDLCFDEIAWSTQQLEEETRRTGGGD